MLGDVFVIERPDDMTATGFIGKDTDGRQVEFHGGGCDDGGLLVS